MPARLASLFAAAALCAAASPLMAQDWHEGPPPPDDQEADARDRDGPMPGRHVIRRIELRHGEGRPGPREREWSRWGGPPPLPAMMPPPGPGMMVPPPPGAPPMMTYAYPSPYPGWVYPPVAWVKVPIVHERRGCGCEKVVEEKIVTREVRPAHRVIRHRRVFTKWVRSTK